MPNLFEYIYITLYTLQFANYVFTSTNRRELNKSVRVKKEDRVEIDGSGTHVEITIDK